jgi:2-dehydro-3-deoxyphosphogluconate aldolase/(4S)-4-hydroxy-2-oxoglutarate aldolase
VEFVKVFPGNSAGGPGFVKDILGPMPYASIIPTGGVDITKESLSGWFKAGVSAVGMGSKLISNDIVQNREWKKLEIRSREVFNLVKSIRSK